MEYKFVSLSLIKYAVDLVKHDSLIVLHKKIMFIHSSFCITIDTCTTLLVFCYYL